MKRIVLIAALMQGFCFPLLSGQVILPERDRAEVVDALLEERLQTVLPALMDREGIDMWILISREYNEDPVLKTFLPATWLSARRRTMLLFNRDKAAGVTEKLAVARYNIGKSIVSAWDKEKQPDQWQRLVELIEARNPDKIALNFSKDHNIADGLDKTDYDLFMEALPRRYHNRVVSAENLAVGWIETRTPREMALYAHLARITHQIIAEAFSEAVIMPGRTTTAEVEWWMRQKVTDLGLDTWFHPTVDIQRTSEALQDHLYSFSDRPEAQAIMPGDLLHCDFGITYLRLNTDCQQLAYVLRPGEREAPAFLREALMDGNRVQDALTSQMREGRTGNDILKAALEAARQQGLQPAIYTHPLGTYGHSAGTTIGMWDAQQGIPGADGASYGLHAGTVYAIELNTTVNLPQWQRDIRVMLEEPGYFGPEGFRYVDGRQTELYLIPRPSANNTE
ncbi:M24 family metallopeptidase [Robiginitalea sp. M366]|uniref:M24 family metallopeptidase n=1 Tax=Robiginitalea aestuariiviva TaxID=3036903 RepID=UPI00240E3D05|nr:M24 family metallopeptidase [Robiginitalea aestuariiviva]MDG1573067.1 M24 family metallopeptidase [Robiginitalea aestuariiviva]